MCYSKRERGRRHILIVRQPRSAPRAIGGRTTACRPRRSDAATASSFQVHDLLVGCALSLARRPQLRGARSACDAGPHSALRRRCAREHDFDYFIELRKDSIGTIPASGLGRPQEAPARNRADLANTIRCGTRTPSSTRSHVRAFDDSRRRRHRRLPGSDAEARLPPGPRRHGASGFCPSIPRRCATMATTSPTTTRQSGYGTLRDFRTSSARRTRAVCR